MNVRMWRRGLNLLKHRYYTTEPEIPTLYSFLQPSIFALNRTPPSSPSPSQPQNLPITTPKSLTLDQKSSLESTLHLSLSNNNTDEAWKSFKTLTSNSAFPSKPLTNSLITHLSSFHDIHNRKRAFASVVYVIEKNPKLLDFETVEMVLKSMNHANTAAPAFALIKCMFKNRFFVPFGVWGNLLVEISRRNGSFVSFLRVFEQNCQIALDEKLDIMKPDLGSCNAALEGCCYDLESVSDAENVIETMAVLGVRPDESSFGFLAYLYALKGFEEKISELEGLMGGFCFTNKMIFYSNLVSGYVKSGKLESVSATIMLRLREGDEHDLNFSEDTYRELVNGYLQNGSVKDLATLIIEAQKLEPTSVQVERSIGYCIVNACVNHGLLDKAHSILDEMNAQGGFVGLGVYVSILKAYCKEHRTAEAAQLVVDISSSGLQLDVGTYDSLIEASMSSQDFQSAFSLFREMREARVQDLNGSYLTIMTGLTENHRPELMAAFLDEVVEDPRIEVGTHDWNSVIHAFCKVGRLEDGRRTLRRMSFLQYEPNDQTYLSLINGYVTAEKYFTILMLWNEVKRKLKTEGEKGIKFDSNLVDAFLYALVKGGFFDAVMQVVEKSQELKIFVDKWRYKQAFMETHKKLRVAKLRRRNFRKMEALIAFKNWAGDFYNVYLGTAYKTELTVNPPKKTLCIITISTRKVSNFMNEFNLGKWINDVVCCGQELNKFAMEEIRNESLLKFSMQISGSFSLDRTSPFTITVDNIFSLLGCSTTSPVFDPNEDLCDTGSGSHVCRGLYSCKGVTGIGLEQNAPTSTCCVYESPIGLGTGYALDLPKLQCSSYTSIYGFGDDEGDPMKWKYGISLQYKDSNYTNACKDCEASGGLCGFTVLDESFACVCPNGVNTTINCLGRGYAWSGTWRTKIQTKMSMRALLLLWMVLFS